MRCGRCGREIPSGVRFCIYCGEKVKGNDLLNNHDAEDTLKKNRRVKVKAVIVTIAVLLLAAAGILVYWQVSDNEDAGRSKGVESVALEEKYIMENGKIYLSSPEAIYEDGSSAILESYTVYINGNECPVESGYVVMPEGFSDDVCDLRLEWQKGEEDCFYETAINIEIEKAEPFDNIKAELISEYGEAEKAVGDSSLESELKDLDLYTEVYDDTEYTYYISPGIMEFCEIDMDKDGSDELLCMRQTEEMAFDCMVYDQTDSGAERIYSLEEDDEVIPERYGGIAVRDGEIPHFVYLNRMTPMCMYYMEGGEVLKYDFRESYEDFEVSAADSYGYMYGDYDDFIGQETNYDEIMLIYCSLFFLRQEIE